MIAYKLGDIGVYWRRADGIEGNAGEYMSYYDAEQAAIALQKELDAKHPGDDFLVYVEARIRDIEIPDALYKLVNSRDKRWGKNGYYWLGCNRGNGSALDRAKQYAAQYHLPRGEVAYPVKLTNEEIERILGK